MKKLISSILCIVLIADSIPGWPDNYQHPLIPPSSLGKVVSSHISQSDKIVILIQDLHANASVQKKIKALLSYYAKQGFDQSIFVEGASGKVDSSILTAAPDSIKEKVCQKLLQTADLSGTEYFAVQENNPYALDGIENQEIYKHHFELFKRSFVERTQLSLAISDLRIVEIASLSNSVLAEKIKLYEAFRQGSLGLLDYFSSLLADSQRLGISLDKNYEALSVLRKWINGDTRTNLDMPNIDGQLAILAFETIERSANTNQEKDKVASIFCLETLGKMLQLQVTNQEIEFLLPWLPSLIRFVNEKFNVDTTEIIFEALNFYQLAYVRDDVLAQNIVSKMNGRNLSNAIAVTGGFHSENIAQKLKEQGISCIVVSPVVTSHTRDDTELYLQKLNSQESTLALAVSNRQLPIQISNIIIELHKMYKTSEKVMNIWETEVVPKIESWAISQNPENFDSRSLIASAEIKSFDPVEQNYIVVLHFKNGNQETMKCPAHAKTKKLSLFSWSKFIRFLSMIVLIFPLFMGVSCEKQSSNPIPLKQANIDAKIEPIKPQTVQKSSQDMMLEEISTMPGWKLWKELEVLIPPSYFDIPEKWWSYPDGQAAAIIGKFVREHPNKYELFYSSFQLMQIYWIDYGLKIKLFEKQFQVEQTLAWRIFAEASRLKDNGDPFLKEYIDNYPKTRSITELLDRFKRQYPDLFDSEVKQVEIPVPKPRAELIPKIKESEKPKIKEIPVPIAPRNVPPNNIVPQKSVMRERIEEIESELRKDEEESAKRPRFSILKYLKDEKAPQIIRYVKAELSTPIDTIFIFTQGILILILSGYVAIIRTWDRLRGYQMKLTERFPILKDETFILWVMCILAYVYSSFTNTSDIISNEQLIFATTGFGLSLYMILFKHDKEVDNEKPKIKNGGFCFLGIPIVVTLLAILAPLLSSAKVVIQLFKIVSLGLVKFFIRDNGILQGRKLERYLFRQA